MRQHEDGYCDECGAEVDVVQLTVEGRELCMECAGIVRVTIAPGVRIKRPEARDDGR